MDLTINRGQSNYLEFRACIRGPGLASTEAEIRDLIASTRLDAKGEATFGSIPEAVDYVRHLVRPDAVAPGGLPEGTRLARNPVHYSSKKGLRNRAQLDLVLPDGTNLVIQYGVAGFDGCEVPNPRLVSIGENTGVVSSHQLTNGRPYSTVIWPATLQDLSGRYGISGELPPGRAVALARSMARRPLRTTPAPTRGCL